jgi:hypothetical protein
VLTSSKSLFRLTPTFDLSASNICFECFQHFFSASDFAGASPEIVTIFCFYFFFCFRFFPLSLNLFYSFCWMQIAKLNAERHIQSAGVDYTIVRPGGLSNDPPSGNLVFGSEDTLFGGRISRDLVSSTANPLRSLKTRSKTGDASLRERFFVGRLEAPLL